jgi:mono/diheme cytochrome c family protein
LGFEMKKLSILLALITLVACETANYAPPVTPAMTRSTSRSKQYVDATKLERGRSLFVHRCIECHTLPPMWKYARQDWPKIVNDMSRRASLKPEDRHAVIAYILAVRAER